MLPNGQGEGYFVGVGNEVINFVLHLSNYYKLPFADHSMYRYIELNNQSTL